MSATMALRFELTVTDTYIDTESITPSELSITGLTGNALRRTVALTADDYTTLDTGDLTPVWWFLMNAHATQDLVVGFGSVDDITLSPGQFSFLRSSKTMFAKGSGGASRLLYAIIT